jgi:hypothetical protein
MKGLTRSAKERIMVGQQLILTSEEHKFLRGLLERVLKDVRIEEHRTRTPLYREFVLHQEDVILGLLNKLQQAPEKKPVPTP